MGFKFLPDERVSCQFHGHSTGVFRLDSSDWLPLFYGHLGSDYAHPIVLAKPAIFEF